MYLFHSLKFEIMLVFYLDTSNDAPEKFWHQAPLSTSSASPLLLRCHQPLTPLTFKSPPVTKTYTPYKLHYHQAPHAPQAPLAPGW